MSNRGSGPVGGEQASLMDRLEKLEEERASMKERLVDLERRLLSAASAGPMDRRAYSMPHDTTNAEGSEIIEDAVGDAMRLTAENTIPKVRECTFVNFKNRFTPEEGRCAVDVLVSGALLQQEIQEEMKIRDRLFEQVGGPSTKASKNKAAVAVQTAQQTTDAISQAQSMSRWPRRIRIQAPALLKILSMIQKETWSDRPRTYFRPFNPLIYHHPMMKKALKELEDRWGAQVDGRAVTDDGNTDDDASSMQETIENSPAALKVLRAYIKFMDERIMPDYTRFEKLDERENPKVRFSDLWYLFRTGELLYRPAEGELSSRRDVRAVKRIWKSYYVSPCSERLEATSTDNQGGDDEQDGGNTSFNIGGYYVEYTGEDFCVVKRDFSIQPYQGELPVAALGIYPIRFAARYQNFQKQALENGNNLIDFIEAKHCAYNGWTLTRSPTGDDTTDQAGKLLQHPEHINSEVMVDFGEAFQQCPSWRPQRAVLRTKEITQRVVSENFTVRWWSDVNRTKLLYEAAEVIPVRTGVTTKQRNKHVTDDNFLKAIAENAKRGRPTTKDDLTNDAKMLLTGRVFAYVFQERKFAQLAVQKLRSSTSSPNALNSLQIDEEVKQAIQGSVQGHFRQKAVERKIDRDWFSLDLIQGKGTGLFILLHGVPGVGKTATAEAIALANGKPLFKITVGDLGMTPDQVEGNLREIFRLASIWDCILLLDEVDTFFSQRTKAESAMKKNALVSVFLRVLDYYNGILFLTTNRPGALDEAFKSRIHYKIYYAPLTWQQTEAIWRLNITRVRRIEEEVARVEKRAPLEMDDVAIMNWAMRHYRQAEAGDMKSYGRWNGRQIRNAFQVARSLAYHEHHVKELQRIEKYQEQVRALELQGRAGEDSDGERRRQKQKQPQQRARGISSSVVPGGANPSRPGDDGSNHSSDSETSYDRQQSVLAPLSPPPPPRLELRHFFTMHEITAQFDRYMLQVRGGMTDADVAHDLQHRFDEFKDKLTTRHLRSGQGKMLQADGYPGMDDDDGENVGRSQQVRGGGGGGRDRASSFVSNNKPVVQPQRMSQQELDREDDGSSGGGRFSTSPNHSPSHDNFLRVNRPGSGGGRPAGNAQTPPSLALPDSDNGRFAGSQPRRLNPRASSRNTSTSLGGGGEGDLYPPQPTPPYRQVDAGNLQTLQPQPHQQRQWAVDSGLMPGAASVGQTPRGGTPAVVDDGEGMPIRSGRGGGGGRRRGNDRGERDNYFDEDLDGGMSNLNVTMNAAGGNKTRARGLSQGQGGNANSGRRMMPQQQQQQQMVDQDQNYDQAFDRGGGKAYRQGQWSGNAAGNSRYQDQPPQQQQQQFGSYESGSFISSRSGQGHSRVESLSSQGMSSAGHGRDSSLQGLDLNFLSDDAAFIDDEEEEGAEAQGRYS